MSNIFRATALLTLLLLPLVTWAQSLDAEAGRVVQDALFLSPEYTVPVTRADGEPVVVAADFNGDGIIDVAILSIASDPRVRATLAELSANERVFDARAIQPLFLLETLFQLSDTIITVELGRQVVFDEITLVELSQTDSPAVRVSFRSSRGTADQLVTFSPDGRASRLRLADSPSEFGELADIDEDGVLEAVTARRVPEAGRGYETFLELYEYSGGAYARITGFGVVRELEHFLEQVRMHVRQQEWQALAGLIAQSDSGDPALVLADAFQLIEVDGEEPAAGAESLLPTAIRDLVTMQFTDNPFPPPYLQQQVRLTFRLDCCGEERRVYAALLELTLDPFRGETFRFLTDQESGR